MNFDEVADLVDGVPHMRRPAGRKVYDHVVDHSLRQILELGTYHGISTCYLAAAVHELGGGRVITMDRGVAKNLSPNVIELAERTGLSGVIEPVFAELSFTWELKKLLEQPVIPQFDFIFLDAGHMWDTTGFAFFLVDRLLRPGGWMLFDDLNWSINASASVADAEWTQGIPEEERAAKQVRAVFDLLVATDPRYTTRVEGNWGWAQKAIDAGPRSEPEGVVAPSVSTALDRAARVARAGVSRIRRRLATR